jgi:hypothetical protein
MVSQRYEIPFSIRAEGSFHPVEHHVKRPQLLFIQVSSTGTNIIAAGKPGQEFFLAVYLSGHCLNLLPIMLHIYLIILNEKQALHRFLVI